MITIKLKNVCLVILAAGILSTVACKKSSTIAAISDGIYSGRFIYRSQNMAYQYKEATVIITFTGQNYTSTWHSDYFPAGGTGTYSTSDNARITFSDMGVHTANFDWNLILNGDYAYHYEGDSLVISKNITSLAGYEYRIKKN